MVDPGAKPLSLVDHSFRLWLAMAQGWSVEVTTASGSIWTFERHGGLTESIKQGAHLIDGIRIATNGGAREFMENHDFPQSIYAPGTLVLGEPILLMASVTPDGPPMVITSNITEIWCNGIKHM